MSHNLVRPLRTRPPRASADLGAVDQWSDRLLAGEDDSLHLWAFLQRNLLLLAACVVLAAVAAVIVTRRITPTYGAAATIRIDQKSWRLPALDALGLTQDNAVATELEMLWSRVLAEEVVDSLALRLVVSSPANAPRSSIFSHVSVGRSAAPRQYRLIPQRAGEFAVVDLATRSIVRLLRAGDRFEARDVAFRVVAGAAKHGRVDFEVRPFGEAVDALRGGLEISRRNRDAEIIDVRYEGTDAQLASEIVNVLVRRYLDDRQGVRRAEARSTVRFLGDQIARVSDRLREAELALQEFRERERLVSPADQASTGVSRQADLQAQRNAIEAERSALRELLRAARAPDRPASESPYRELLAFPTLLRSGMAATMLESLTNAEERRSVLLERRTPEDPEVQTLDARIAALQGQIEALVRTYLQGLTNQVAALDSLVARSDAKLQSIPTNERRLAEFERTAKSSEAIYSMLQSRLQEAQIAEAASDLSVRLVDPAVTPRKPVSPKPVLNVAVAIVAGLALGIAAGFARELADRSFHTRRDLVSAVGAPVVGMIPNAARRTGLFEIARPSTGRLQTIVHREAFSWLATNLAFLPKSSPNQVLVVTSALPGDGKTTVATNLALTLARNGRRVLLVDADLRGGRVGAAFRLRHGPGLGELLAGTVQRELAITRISLTEGSELHVIVSGSRAAVPTQLLASPHLPDLVEWSRHVYDLTIIDTAPVSVAADAALLGSQSDGVLVVVRAGSTNRAAVEFAMEQLAIAQAPIAGTVLNAVDLRRAGAYDHALRYGARYGDAARAQSATESAAGGWGLRLGLIQPRRNS